MATNSDEDYLTLHEFVRDARLKLDQYIWDYLVGGTETETTLRRNRAALDAVAFRPRVLVDVSHVDATHSFLGRRIRLPVALAPVGSLQSFEAGGGASVAAGAGAFGVPQFVSSVTQPSLEETAAAGAGPKVFQLYVRGDDAFIDGYVHRAEAAGYDAFCITVDTAVLSRRERDIAKRFRKPWQANNTGMAFQSGLDWATIERFKKRHRMPLILKGIMTPQDALRARDIGVDVIYISNHGGRQLDHGLGSFAVLAEIREALGKEAVIYVDGAFSRGTDILKGLAAGANLVVIGRLYLYGLASAGAAGVTRVLEILEHEIETTLGLLGATSLTDLGPHLLHPAPLVSEPHVHSAFPLLRLGEGY